MYKNKKGKLYLSENFICFHFKGDQKIIEEKIIIPFREIKLIKKKSWIGQSAISVYNEKEEFYFHAFGDNFIRDEIFVLMEQLIDCSNRKVIEKDKRKPLFDFYFIFIYFI